MSRMSNATDNNLSAVLRDHDLADARRNMSFMITDSSMHSTREAGPFWDGTQQRRRRQLFKIQPSYQLYDNFTQPFGFKQIIAVVVVLPFAIPYLFGTLQYFTSALMNIFITVRPCHENSAYYSAVPTIRQPSAKLPPVIVQMPIYMEDLKEVIMPTLLSLEQAVTEYQRAGGSAKIFINDDGLQVMLARGMLREVQGRMALYNRWKNKLCVVARPTHDRRGYFKKGSNMNYCLRVARRITALAEEQNLTPKQARKELLKDQPDGHAFIAGGDLTIPDDTIILLVDSDTRVHADCILKVVPEFVADPSVGYGQCITSAMPDQRQDFFQRLIWDFTFKIYHLAIMPDVARGHIAPLVGHNAFISWKALDACRMENEHGPLWWSESHVSEDFDLAMRMMSKAFIGRYITYTDGFEEGISLTFPEEEKKVVKFAYGAAEMLFNPIRYWPFRSPISKLFRSFWGTKQISFFSKVKMLFYLLEYFAIGMAPIWVLAEVTSILIGGPGTWTELGLVRSFDVTLFTIFVFSVAGPIGTIAFIFRVRIATRRKLLFEIWDQFKYTILTTIQWTSYSWRFSDAIVRYLLSIKMTSWGATSKEASEDVFTDNEVRDVLVPLYGKQMLISLFLYASWSFYTWLQSVPVPEGFGMYAINFAYFTAPILLNPNLTRFRY